MINNLPYGSDNMEYRVRYAHPNFAYGKTIHIPNIMFNLRGRLQSYKKL